MIIAISNFKGGVAKTSSTINIGAALAVLEQKVLLIDMDPQFNLSTCLGVESTEHNNIYGVLMGKYGIKPTEVIDNLFIVPSHIELIKAEIELSTKFRREEILSNALSDIKENFDYILIDCPPSIGTLTINAMVAADEIYVPLEPEYLALTGYRILNDTLDSIGLTLDHIIVTKHDARTVLHRDIVQSIRQIAPDKVFDTMIRKNISIAEATTQGVDIFRYAPKSNGAIDYMNLAKEIMSNG